MDPVLRYAAAALLLVPGPALYALSDDSTLRWVRGRVLEYEEHDSSFRPAR